MTGILDLVAAQPDALRGAGLAVLTAGVVFVALLAVGFALLARRSRSPRSTSSTPSDDYIQRANIALVQLDDEVAASADEVGFAVAQFGNQQAAALSAALSSARSNLVSAFALKQQLDDAVPDSETQRREWTARILMQCETATERLLAERSSLHGLRQLEQSAPGAIVKLRELSAHSRLRLPTAISTVASLATAYTASAVAPVVANPADAERLLDEADARLAAAESRRRGPGGAAVSVLIVPAERDVQRAVRLIDDVDAHAKRLAASSAGLDTIAAQARSAIVDARGARDAPPDPATGSAITEAISAVERALAAARVPGKQDPDAAVARIEAATDTLDTTLAGARTGQQRLDHARDALAGALLTAKSQVETTRAYISGRRGGAGAEARTRLAEAERLLTIAEAESDPVIALDTARSSATYSRDADALARYDLLH